jgi:hypothetical protein
MEKGRLWWSVAEFANVDFGGGVLGAPVRKFVEEEIRRLKYTGRIIDFGRLS